VATDNGCALSEWSAVRSFATVCPVAHTGDVNMDGVINSADVVYLINFVFEGGPEPLPIWQAGDVNCDGRVTGSDIVYLNNYVFKGGSPPCDVCSTM
jgi:hypothetical protein